MITTVKLIHTSLTSHSYICMGVVWGVVRTLKKHSLSKFEVQVHNILILTIVTMLYI